MDELTLIALSQDTNLFLKFKHLQEINRIIRTDQNDLWYNLSWEYTWSKGEIEELIKSTNNRFNIFRWFDRRILKKARTKHQILIDKIYSLGFIIKDTSGQK